MANQLFRNFLHDAAEYSAAEGYWLALWEEVVCEAGQAGEWEHPWLQSQFGDGTPFRDGNPIFSAVSRSRGRGVRVIQYEPESEFRELDSWVDFFGGQPGQPGVIRELVISCALSQEAAADARDLLYAWMVAGEVDVERGVEGPPRVILPPERSARKLVSAVA